MNGTKETRSEIRARIDEIESVLIAVGDIEDTIHYDRKRRQALKENLNHRLRDLNTQLEQAEEDLSASIVRSHIALCKAKQMDVKGAYGNDPAMYYTLGICGEAGEMANAIVKARRNGEDQERVLEAVKGELPDVIIYSYVLAFVLDIDLAKLVNDKVSVVVERAQNGYYGPPLIPGARGSSW